MVEKITQREAYRRIMEAMSDDEQVVEFCRSKIAQLERVAPTKADPRKEEERSLIVECLRRVGLPMTSKQVSEETGLSGRKVAGHMRVLAQEERVQVIQASSPKEVNAYIAL